MDRKRDLDSIGPRRDTPPSVRHRQDLVIDELAEHLLDKQRVALSCLDDASTQICRQFRTTRQDVDQGTDRTWIERV